jgi:hypothetical protein
VPAGGALDPNEIARPEVLDSRGVERDHQPQFQKFFVRSLYKMPLDRQSTPPFPTKSGVVAANGILNVVRQMIWASLVTAMPSAITRNRRLKFSKRGGGSA